MATSAGFNLVHADDLERTGRWSLVRRSLGIGSFGMNLVELEPGAQIPEHDESERDQEEVFIVLSGHAAVVVDGKAHAAPALSFARVDPEHKRTVRNTGSEPVTLLIASAPRSSGYEPME